jgi:hypothetical protein
VCAPRQNFARGARSLTLDSESHAPLFLVPGDDASLTERSCRLFLAKQQRRLFSAKQQTTTTAAAAAARRRTQQQNGQYFAPTEFGLALINAYCQISRESGFVNARCRRRRRRRRRPCLVLRFGRGSACACQCGARSSSSAAAAAGSHSLWCFLSTAA